MKLRRHTNNDARNQIKAGGPYWTLKAIAKRNGLKAESRLPESKPLPPPPIAYRRGVVTRLKEGEIALTGWQYAPAEPPKWLTRAIELNAKKARGRAKYERRFRRHAVRVSGECDDRG